MVFIKKNLFSFFKFSFFFFLFLFNSIYSQEIRLFGDSKRVINAEGDSISFRNKGKDLTLTGNAKIEDDLKNLIKSDLIKISEEKNEKRILIFENLKEAKMIFSEEQKGKIINGIDILRANKVFAIYDLQKESIDFAKLEKNVYLERQKDNNENIKVFADMLIYDPENKISKINNIKKIEYKDKNKDNYIIYCDNMIWDMEKDIVEFFGKPIIYKKIDESYIVKSKKAVFYKKENLVVFSKKPILYQKDTEGKGVYNSSEISFSIDKKILNFNGNVELEYIPNKKEKI
jgi:lipopolysaccharide export system protein LptA